ncbi:hypothetical protein NUU61_009565 [Penicillium alfredii]|uniref:CNH domain-containing protein n=1 Tax=Penicillium alfredii TaxID=1506179 RepID=A0A9W9JTR1_9EURO|nr:uncharacterized protein NUU61_009565 [Penicillium alfredii]KAJ5081301.1 hypothetical protein NUU61_009565 [Penicillium alfredii]
MLSAFTARPLVELKPRDKSRIDSVLAYGDRLLAGLNNGSLRIYRVTDEGTTELLRELERFSRYKIEQLALIKEANVLVALSGGYVSLHNAQTYEPLEQLAQTKGASAFAITSNVVNDPDTNVPAIVSRLAVAVKRKILMWVWQDMELERDTTELSLVSGIKTLTWVSATRLVVGLSSNYVMVHIETGQVAELAGPGSIEESGRFTGVGVASMSYIGMGGMVPRPLATRLREGQILLAKDINTRFIDVEGQPLGRRQIPWSHAPVEIGYSYPFLLALHDSAKGVLEVRNPETLSLLQSIPLPSASLLHIPQPNISLAHAGKGFLVASDRSIWRMEGLSYDTQIDALVEKGYLDEAISLLGMLEDALLRDKPGRLRAIRLEKAQSLFALHKYRDSLDLFTEITAPPETVIRLYPRLIAGDLSAIPEPDTDKVNGSQPDGSSEAAAPGQSSMYAPSVRSFLRRTDEGSDSSSNRDEEKDLKVAVRELQGYLADVRRRFQRFLNPDGSLKAPVPTEPKDDASDSVLKLLDFPPTEEFASQIQSKARLVDTTLFRAHMYATPSLAGSLFRIANFCDPEVVMERLEETGRYNDLIDFLYGKRLHRQALKLLQRFGQEDSGLLSGPTRTIAYLQNLSPDQIDLVLEFGEWPLRTSQELGMEIFLTDTENAETLPRPRVLEFLEGIDPKLAIQYLEHVIHEWNDLTPDLHQRLLVLYLDQFIHNKPSAEWKAKFLGMLRESEQYSPAKMLDRLNREDPEFYEARAIVFSKMGQHRQALEIYVFKLEDHEKAEEYCNQVHLTEKIEEESESSIYLTLLSLYLAPPHGYQPQNGPALAVLAKHGSRLPADAALGLIPRVLPVQELEFYFKGRMRAANSAFNEARIVASLRKARDMQIQAQLVVGEGVRGGATRARHVTVTEERICGVCHKRLGGSVINVFPDNSVVHLGCANRVPTVRSG